MLINKGMDADIDTGLRLEIYGWALCFAHEDRQKMMSAFLNKSKKYSIFLNFILLKLFLLHYLDLHINVLHLDIIFFIFFFHYSDTITAFSFEFKNAIVDGPAPLIANASAPACSDLSLSCSYCGINFCLAGSIYAIIYTIAYHLYIFVIKTCIQLYMHLKDFMYHFF